MDKNCYVYLNGKMFKAKDIYKWSLYSEMIGTSSMFPKLKVVKSRIKYWKPKQRKKVIKAYKAVRKQMKAHKIPKRRFHV